MTRSAPRVPHPAGDEQIGWRSLADPLTTDQIAHLSAMERHPAYRRRPELLMLESLELVEPGCVAEHMISMATRA